MLRFARRFCWLLKKCLPSWCRTWDNGKVTQKPTLTKEGVKTYTCTVCADTKTERIEKLTDVRCR